MSILKFCNSINFINNDNFDFVFTRLFAYSQSAIAVKNHYVNKVDEIYLFSACGEDVLSILDSLHKTNLLTQDNFNRILSNRDYSTNGYFCWILKMLCDGQILTQQNLNVAIERKAIHFYTALKRIVGNGRLETSITLTQQVFEELIKISIVNLDLILQNYSTDLIMRDGAPREFYISKKFKEFNDSLISYTFDKLIHLDNAGYFTQENVNALAESLDRHDVKNFAEVLVLTRTANCSIVRNSHTFYSWYWNFSETLEALHALHSAHILTQEILDAFDRICFHGKGMLSSPKIFVEIMLILHNANCLTRQNISRFVTSPGDSFSTQSSTYFMKFHNSIEWLRKLNSAKIVTQENLDAIFIADSPESYTDILVMLCNANCLTSASRTFYLTFTGSTAPLKTLSNAGILTQENIDFLLKAKSPETYAEILVLLQNSRCLTSMYRKSLLTFTGPTTSLKTLSNAGILTLENITALYELVHAESKAAYAEILVMLRDVECLTSENRLALLPFTGFLNPIRTLYKSCILTQATLDALLIAKSQYTFIETLTFLSGANCLMPQNKMAFLNFLNLPCSMNLLNALNNQGILTQDNLDSLIISPDPVKFVDSLVVLNRVNLLTSENRTAFLQFQGKNKAFHALHARGILMQTNINLLLDPANNYLSSEGATSLLWDRLPPHLLTQNVFNNLIIQAQTAMPQEAVTHYVNQLLAPPPPVRLRRAKTVAGDSQSTHKVHDSVAASLLRLAARYNLTTQEIDAQLTEFKNFSNVIRTGNFNHLNDMILGENKCAPAIDSITRLTTMANDEDINIEEAQTQFPLKKIIALMWTAVTDEAVHDQSIGLNAKERLINELSNVQLAYGVDALGRAQPSCDGGTMNGLVNILDGIHPDVTLVLINNDIVFELMLRHARQIFIESFEQKAVEPAFVEQVHQEVRSENMNHWNNTILEQWYENCLNHAVVSTEQEITLKCQQAQFSTGQISSLNARVRNEWIPQSLTGLRLHKYMLHDTVEKYEDKLNAAKALAQQSTAETPEMDDFDRLIEMIESAILAERQSQNNASVSHSNIFSKVSFEKIGEFTSILRTKNSANAIEWLQIKENFSELETGATLHNSLKHQLKIQNPFGCSNLRELENCLSTVELLNTSSAVKT